MKRIVLMMIVFLPFMGIAQSYTITPTINAVRISDSLGNSRLYPLNSLYLNIGHDSTYVQIKNVNLVKDPDNMVMPSTRYGSIINGKTSAAFSSVAKIDSFFAAFLTK